MKKRRETASMPMSMEMMAMLVNSCVETRKKGRRSTTMTSMRTHGGGKRRKNPILERW